MKSSDVICRMAVEEDDISAIAEYIYMTDPYIYPTIVEDPCKKLWQELIRSCYFAKNNIFSMENIMVAEIDGRIVGILCAVACGERKRFIEDIPVEIGSREGFKKANEGYFEPLIEETESFEGFNITNFCVDVEFHKKGIGTKLMDYCLRRLGDSKVHLDVIADNLAAVRLYEKMGFVTVSEYYGFSGTEEPLPCYHMERMPKKGGE